MNVRKLWQLTPASVVFGVAAWQSYWHTVEVAQRYGEGASAYIMPLSVDGLMIVAARFLDHARTRAGRWLAGVSFGMGVVVMLGANILAADPNPLSRVVAAYPALAMVAVAALLHWAPVRTTPRRRKRPANVTPMRRRRTA
jgi:hypothetical protein